MNLNITPTIKFKKLEVKFIPQYFGEVIDSNGRIFKLNSNDISLLIFCKEKERWIGEIAKHLNIAPKNVSVRLLKLESLGIVSLIKVGHGRKTFVKTLVEVPQRQQEK